MPRVSRVLAPAVLIAAAFAALVVGMQLGGAGDKRSLLDPGVLVRYGLPAARMLVNMGMATLMGAAFFRAWSLSERDEEAGVAMDVAATGAAVTTVASLATLLFTYLDVTGYAFSLSSQFGAGLAQFVTEIELGALWLWEVIIAAVATVLAFAFRGKRGALIVVVASAVAVVPIAQQGHAAGAANHSQAVNSLLVHLVGASVWLGGLILLVVLAPRLTRVRLAELTGRYSVFALLAFVGVSASGVSSAALRVGSFEALLATEYGELVLVKTALIVVLGCFGAVHRMFLIPRIASSVRGGFVFVWVVVAELAVMGLANGIASALARSQTPVSLEPLRDQGVGTSPAEWLSGDPLPPELGPARFLSEWKFDLGWQLVCVFGAGLYFAGVIVLRRRGDRWPLGRSVAWLSGLVMLFYTTNGPFNAYEQYLFSMHMLEHMMLTMLIPLVLSLGAPVTLALRAVRKRRDGSWGGREWILWLVQTPYAKFITHPIVAAVVFAGSLWVFYFTPIFRWAMEDHIGHTWMILHFLIGGYLFSLSMVGVDPVAYRFPYPLRIVTLFATMASHAFFGVTIMTQPGLMLASWFGAMGRTWGDTPLVDQNVGGGIAWGIGEFPTLILALVVAVQWAKSDEREQKRRDRAADRSGEAELAAYNEMLARRAVRR